MLYKTALLFSLLAIQRCYLNTLHIMLLQECFLASLQFENNISIDHMPLITKFFADFSRKTTKKNNKLVKLLDVVLFFYAAAKSGNFRSGNY